MKAAVMHEVAKPMRIENIAVPEIGPEEVLVETRTCGICGTDLHILSGFGYVPPLPHILGHEPAGVVAAVGNKVTNLKPGDRVAPYLFINCEHCYYCRVGRHEQCTELKGIVGVLVPGAFAEYFKAPAANLYALPDNVAFDVGGLLADAVVTSVHAYKRSGLHLGDTAVVMGSGGVGLTLVQILKAAGVRVAAVDRSHASVNLAKQMGADVVGKSTDPETAAKIEDFTHGFGAQCVFDCVGKSQTIKEGADYVMKCGRIVVIGEERDDLSINTTEIAQRELEIIGSRNGTRQDMLEAIGLVEAGIVKPQIARHFPLDEINNAFDFLRRGTLGRVIIEIGKA